jgi:hypothetical protein
MSDAQLNQAVGSVSQAVNALNKTMANTFPQQGGTSTTAVAGTATLPANPVGFLTVTISGVARKIPFYA